MSVPLPIFGREDPAYLAKRRKTGACVEGDFVQAAPERRLGVAPLLLAAGATAFRVGSGEHRWRGPTSHNRGGFSHACASHAGRIVSWRGNWHSPEPRPRCDSTGTTGPPNQSCQSFEGPGGTNAPGHSGTSPGSVFNNPASAALPAAPAETRTTTRARPPSTTSPASRSTSHTPSRREATEVLGQRPV
jgi:hypothetical protein